MPDRAEYTVTPEQLANFAFSEQPVSISELTKRLNDLVNQMYVKELKRASSMAADGAITGMMAADPIVERMTRQQLEKSIAETTRLMKEAAKNLEFLQAAQYRDEIIRLQKELEIK